MSECEIFQGEPKSVIVIRTVCYTSDAGQQAVRHEHIVDLLSSFASDLSVKFSNCNCNMEDTDGARSDRVLIIKVEKISVYLRYDREIEVRLLVPAKPAPKVKGLLAPFRR